MEKRLSDCYQLKLLDETKPPIERSGRPHYKIDTLARQVNYYNSKTSALVSTLNASLVMKIHHPLFTDATGIRWPIDFCLPYKKYDILSLNAALVPYGLHLVPGQVLVDRFVLSQKNYSPKK